MRRHLLILALATACGDKDDTGSVEDLDGDGYGVAQDCDDGNASVNPGAPEQPYDGLDNDCDSSTLDDDLDGDGFIAEEDCDDDNADAFPGGVEYCDGADNDCDDEIDEQALDTLAWFADYDSDGYGDPEVEVLACQSPPAYVADDSDCDDGDAEIHPGAQEPYDGVDNDCDGEIDEHGGAPTFEWFHDGDGDGYGDLYDMTEAEKQPYGYVPNDNDCDDNDSEIHPGADERCNDLDDDCDVQIDEDGACQELDIVGADDWWSGDDYGDQAGTSLAGGQDLTGDGTDDFIIGAPGTSSGGSFYFMPGEYTGYFTGLELDEASSSGAITWATTMSGAELGDDVALFRDVDGDGEVDFGAGAPEAEGTGIAVLWFSSIEDYSYVSISGGRSELGGVASAGDMNRDGLTDMLIGAPGADADVGDEGFVEVYLGDASAQMVAGQYWMGDNSNDELGSEIAGAGDVDGDGLRDALMAGRGYPSGGRNGAVWMVLGRGFWPGSEGSLSDVEHMFVGEAAGDHAGHALAGGQDFDGDGYDDFAMGAPYNNSGGSDEGEVYLWSGGRSWSVGGGSWSMASAPTTFLGEGASSRAGYALDFVRDFDGDGAPDLAVGAPYLSSSSALRGKVYLLHGGPGACTGSCDLADATISWVGESPGDRLGSAIASGDANADGLFDLMISAPTADVAGTESGNLYLVLGW